MNIEIKIDYRTMDKGLKLGNAEYFASVYFNITQCSYLLTLVLRSRIFLP
jgi:hypothetical protein